MLFELKPSEVKALKYIATHGPMTAYALPSEVSHSQTWSYSMLKRLTNLAYLQVENMGVTRAGLPMKFYKPTFWGLSNALPTFKEQREVNDGLKHFRGFDTVVLDNFDFYVKKFGVNEAHKALRIAASAIAQGVWPNEKGERLGFNYSMLEFFRSSFFDSLINPVRFWEIERHVSEWGLPDMVKDWLVKWLQRRHDYFEAQTGWSKRFLEALRG